MVRRLNESNSELDKVLYKAIKYEIETYYPDNRTPINQVWKQLNDGTKASENFKRASLEDYAFDVLNMKSWDEFNQWIENLYCTESVNKKSVKEDVQSDWLDNITFVMYKYVQSKMYGVKIVEDTEDGNFRVSYEGEVVDISFDTTEDGYYVYTINDEGPYTHHSYEFIRGDIMQYVDTLYGVENDEEE